MKRYMVVEHTPERLRYEGTKLIGQLPIHGLLGLYHWHQLDDQHVICIATHSLSTHKALHEHPKVSVLPTLGSQKKLCKHVKEKHFDCLKKVLGVTDEHTSEDVIDMLGERFGPMFAA